MPVLGAALQKGLSIVASEDRPLLTHRSGVSTIAGRKVGPETALTAAAVYSATSLLAQTVAELPIDFVRREDTERRPRQPEGLRAFWARPNPYQTRIAFYETLVLSMLIHGNFYGYPRRNTRGDILEVWPLDPQRITEVESVENEDGTAWTRFWLDGFTNEEGTSWLHNIPGRPPEIIHIPWMTAPGRVKGMSPVEFHAELIGMSLSAQEHAARFLGEGTHKSGVIEHPNPLTPEEAKQVWDGWQMQHSGPKKAGSIAVLTAGSKFNPITIPPNELQFLEQMKFTDRKIASLYRVPPHMIGDTERSTSWGTGIAEQTQGFLTYTLLPILRRIEEAVEALPNATGLQMKFNVNGLMRGVAKDRGEFYNRMWNLGAMNQDEIRAFEDMPPIPNGQGQRYLVPLNMRPIDEEVSDED